MNLSLATRKMRTITFDDYKMPKFSIGDIPLIAGNPLELILDRIFLRINSLRSLESNVFLKIEGFNLAGSIKFKPAIYMLERLEKSGKIIPGYSTIIESSSGNLGVALSLACAVKGYKFICISDPNISKRNKRYIELFGGRILVIKKSDKNGGFLNTRIDTVKKMISKDKSLIWLNQYANLDNKNAHFLSTASSIFDSIPQVDYLFIGSGTTGTLMGCAEYIRMHNLTTKIIAVEPVGSVTFDYPPSKRCIPGLGTSRKPELVNKDLIDDIVLVKEEDTIKMCREILQKEKLLLGGSTGTVLAGIEAYTNKLRNATNIVAISPDLGDGYLDTVYNDKWVEKHFPSI
jgi:N-(2-amino-2-carboxyethyl)-L-glutamate synthase